MLRINRIRIEIATEKGLCGFDTELNHGLNFLTSQENTCGKVPFWLRYIIALV